MAVVVLKLAIEGNSTTFNVSGYVLQSSKPLWNGDLYDCALLLPYWVPMLLKLLDSGSLTLMESW